MTETNNTLDDRHAFRINKSDKKNFVEKCELLEVDPAELSRELIVAFNDDRVTIQPDSTKRESLKLKEKLYNVN